MTLVALTRMLSANIQGAYSRGRYGEYDVIIRVDDGFMNASKLCLSRNKCIYVWIRANDELIEKCDSQITVDYLNYGVVDNQSIDHVKNVHIDIDGVYISPYLMPSLSGWLDPAFIFNSARIINRYLAHEYMDIFEQMKKDSANQMLTKLIPKPKVNTKCIVIVNCGDTICNKREFCVNRVR